MARITVVTVTRDAQEPCVIRIRGVLCAADLHRLERACGRLLERERLDLRLVFDAAGAMDSSARAYVDRLQARGASVTTVS